MDGGAAPESSASAREEVHWNLREARRTGAFWILTGVFSALALAVGMIALHRIANFSDRGLDPTLVALAISFDAVLAGLVTLAMGWIGGRVRSQRVGAVGLTALAASCVITIQLQLF